MVVQPVGDVNAASGICREMRKTEDISDRTGAGDVGKKKNYTIVIFLQLASGSEISGTVSSLLV